MLSLLFDGGFWYDLLFIALAIGIVYLCFKYKSAKYWVATIAMVALVIFTGYCGIQLNAYYSAEGGIWGYIDGLINPNTGTVQVVSDKLEFTIDNIVMTEQIDGTYSAKIYLPDVLQLEEGKNYSVSVNDEPCSKVEFSAGTTSYARAEYAYAFMDTNLNTLCVDTLVFNVSLFKTSTDVTISSNGGQTAVDYWNTYFAKNEFKVSIFADDYVHDDSIEYVEGDVSNYHTLTYYVDDEVYMTQIFDNTKAVTLVDGPAKTDIAFSHWIDADGNKLNQTSKFNADTTIYAVYVEAEPLKFEFYNNSLSLYTGTNETDVVVPESYSITSYGAFVEGNDYVVEKISMHAFANNDAIKSITLPKTIRQIKYSMMTGLDGLDKLIILCDIIPEFPDEHNYFGDAGGEDGFIIYVPDDLLEAYELMFQSTGYTFAKLSEL